MKSLDEMNIWNTKCIFYRRWLQQRNKINDKKLIDSAEIFYEMLDLAQCNQSKESNSTLNYIIEHVDKWSLRLLKYAFFISLRVFIWDVLLFDWGNQFRGYSESRI